MNLKKLLNTQSQQLALVIGNGINRYNSTAGLNSWDAMLLELWERHTQEDAQIIPLGISLTEFYDALDLSSQLKEKNLQKEFCDFLTGWEAKEHHQRIVNWAANNNSPILTTNFDETLSNCLALDLHHADGQRFTDFYPWFCERCNTKPRTRVRHLAYKRHSTLFAQHPFGIEPLYGFSRAGEGAYPQR